MKLRIEERIHPDAASSETTKENVLSQMGKTSHWEIFRDPAQVTLPPDLDRVLLNIYTNDVE